jgi:hypothetical protein
MAYLFWGLVDRSSTTHMWSLQLRKDEEKAKVTLIQNLGGKMHLHRSDFHIPTGFWGGSMVCHGFPGFPNLFKYQSWDLLIRWVFMDSSIRNSWENHQLGKWWVSPRRNSRDGRWRQTSGLWTFHDGRVFLRARPSRSKVRNFWKGNVRWMVAKSCSR